MRSSAFTLTELLVVIGLIVLIVALALPAFNAISGGRSTEAAANQLSALLARVRAEAIGAQAHRGLLFYLDPASDRLAATIVKEAPFPATGAPAADLYLDLVADRDVTLLPPGVGVQTVYKAANAAGNRNDDGYIGLNAHGDAPNGPALGGAILFDGQGRVASREYGYLLRSNAKSTAMGRLLFPPGGPNAPDFLETRSSNPTLLSSQIGLVLFEREPFQNQFAWSDPFSSYPTTESDKETWLDNNAVPYLVNRYNGTLIRGE